MAEETGKKWKTAWKFGVDPAGIRRWLKDKQKIQEMVLKIQKTTAHNGPNFQYKDLENTFYAWILEERKKEKAVSTSNITDRAVFLSPNFKNGDEKKRFYWCTNFCLIGIHLYAQELVSGKSRTQQCILWSEIFADAWWHHSNLVLPIRHTW